MNQHRQAPTLSSERNAEALGARIRVYDPLLSVFFFPKGNFYYVGRPLGRLATADPGPTLGRDEETVYSHAFRRRHLVICQPIPIHLMEDFSRAVSSVWRHLEQNDMWPWAATAATRVAIAETKNDAENQIDSRRKESIRGDIRHRAREIFRERAQISNISRSRGA